MAVTTRTYSIAQATPVSILGAIRDAFTDLQWHEPEVLGYALAFTNTPGSLVASEANKRYLVTPSATSGSGIGALFDVARSPYGAIQTVTLVTGGSGYTLMGINGATSSGTTVTVASTAGLVPGMVVTKLTGGTGALATNTLVASVTNGTTFVLSQAPTTALGTANLQFADTITLSAASIGGSSYALTGTTGTSGQSTVTVTNDANVMVGQTVTGTGIGDLCVVTSISNNVITLSKPNTANISGTVTFSDQIICTLTGTCNNEGIVGTASGLTITGVSTNANITIGSEVTVQSGSATLPVGEKTIVASITGTGPYVVTLRNFANDFKGFTGSGAITFKVSKGGSDTWFDNDLTTNPLSAAWAVARVKNSNDRLGTTYWKIMVASTASGQFPLGGGQMFMYIKAMTGFNKNTNSAQGVGAIDWSVNATAVTLTGYTFVTQVATSAFVPLTLRTRQSALDPNFVTFAFYEGSNNNRNPFFFSKYNSNTQPWSLNDVFLGGITEIAQTSAFNTNDAGINFRQRMAGLPKRQAEAGYSNYNQAGGNIATNTFFRSVTGNRGVAAPVAVYDDIAFYSRQYNDIQTSVSSDIPVYKSIPINPHFMPVPYYLPDDFVMVEIPWGNPAIGDTITVNAGEVYTIIQVAVNQITYTALALCARTT